MSTTIILQDGIGDLQDQVQSQQKGMEEALGDEACNQEE